MIERAKVFEDERKRLEEENVAEQSIRISLDDDSVELLDESDTEDFIYLKDLKELSEGEEGVAKVRVSGL